MSSDPIKKSSNKFNIPSDIASKYNYLYKMYKAAASNTQLDYLGIDDQETFEGLFDSSGVEILIEGLNDKKKQLEFMEKSGITHKEKFVVPSDIAMKYNDLYEMYKANVSEEKLKQDGINNLDDFTGLLSKVQGIHLLLDELPEEKQSEFMKTSGIKKYSDGGRNRKRRSKKRRGNRRKSTRRRSRR